MLVDNGKTPGNIRSAFGSILGEVHWEVMGGTTQSQISIQVRNQLGQSISRRLEVLVWLGEVPAEGADNPALINEALSYGPGEEFQIGVEGAGNIVRVVEAGKMVQALTDENGRLDLLALHEGNKTASPWCSIGGYVFHPNSAVEGETCIWSAGG